MIKENSRANEPRVRAEIDSEEPNVCTVCGTRTEFIEAGPWDEYWIERCGHCGQLHHFYAEED